MRPFGVGVSTPIQNLFLVFFIAIGSGVTVMVAQYFGAKNTMSWVVLSAIPSR
jgi:Na+-driven multidrug efflux pump